MAVTSLNKGVKKIEKARQLIQNGALSRDDSDDELGYEDLPWEWIYHDTSASVNSKKRKTRSYEDIVAARMGRFVCNVGDTVFLKSADNHAWVGIICFFWEDDQGDKLANIMWFSSPSEIHNKAKKRTDFMPVWLRKFWAHLYHS